MNNTSIRIRRLPSGLYNSFPTYRYTCTGSKIGKIICGFFLIFSLVVSGTLFQGLGIPPLRVQEASAQLGPIPGLFGNPGSSDFLSLAVAIMPTMQGADLNVSNVAGSTNCDLLVPVTYIDGGCMSSLPLLTPFTVQPNVTQPVNETAFVDYNYSQPSTLGVSIGLSSDNITAGETQTVTVTVSDENSTDPISGAYITSNITDSYGTSLNDYTGTTDDTGQTSFDYAVPADALSDYYEVLVTATADGYDNATSSTTFEVIGSDSDAFYDNSTFDDSSSGDYNYDDGSSSSSDNNNNNDDFDSPTVKSVDPSPNAKNVPTNTEIKVTFSEKMDQDTLDENSLNIFNQGNGIDPNVVKADTSSKSVTYTLSPDLEQGTEYEAQLEFDIQDDNGNYLDCSDSNDIDSSCTWRFTTTDSSSGANIQLNPISGPILTPISVTGTGFASSSIVTITFEGSQVATTTTTPTGSFATSFNVPISSSIGEHTVKATQGSNSASKTFQVTQLLNPIVNLDPTSGLAGSTVGITGAGFNPTSPVSITFDDQALVPPITVTPDANGVFSASFTVPDGSSIGAHIVKATQGAKSAQQTFTVTPKITLNPSSGPIGSTVDIAGTLFAPTSTVTITFDGQALVPPITVTPDINGEFDTSFTVPDGSSIGAHIVKATQGTNSASATFTVSTSFAPITNQLSINTGNLTSIESPSNQSDSSNVTNAPSQSESNVTKGQNETASGPTFNNENQTNAPTSYDSGSKAPDSATNDTEPVTSVVSPESTAKNEAPPEDALKQPIDNQSSTYDAKSVSSSIDDTKSNSQSISSEAKSDINSVDEEKPSPKDIEQDRKDRLLFEKYLRGDDAESKQEKNSSPVAMNDEAKTIENTPVTIAILSNDRDPDDDKLEIMGISPPQKGKVETNGDGSIIYAPEKSWAGKEVFSYTVGDGNGGIATASVQVEVQPASINNHEPRAIDQAISGNENTPEKIQLKAEDPDDGDKLAFKIVKEPSHGKIADFSAEKGTLTYLPEKDYQGKDGFTFRVTDGMAESKDGKITIEIKPGKDTIQEEQAQDQKQQQEQQHQQDQSQEKQSDNNNNDQGKKTDGNDNQQSSGSGEDKGSQSEDQKQQQDEPKDEQKSEPPKEEQKSASGESTDGN